tara:strand:+ start:182 stop:454 length:273 start_codon:yes stop_codon:yes gene_type:complete
MIAIHTKYIQATNTKGSRIKAYTASYGTRKGFTATIPYRYESSNLHGHFQAVEALVKNNNLDWDLADMRYGDSADAKGYSFCFNNSTVEV